MSGLFASQIIDLKSLLPWERVKRRKIALRGIMDQRRRVLTEDTIREESALIQEKLEQHPYFRSAKVILLYYPVHHEVDLRPLLTKYEGDKTFLFPIAHRHSLEVRPYAGEELMKRGRFGIPEPQTLPYEGKVDLIVAPGVAFDNQCRRLGHGSGYYDRFIRRMKTHVIGVCYDCQLYSKDLPHNWLDNPVDVVITHSKTIGE